RTGEPDGPVPIAGTARSPDSQQSPDKGCFLPYCGDGRRPQNHKRRNRDPAERNRRSGTLPQCRGKDIGALFAADLLCLASLKRSNCPEWIRSNKSPTLVGGADQFVNITRRSTGGGARA